MLPRSFGAAMICRVGDRQRRGGSSLGSSLNFCHLLFPRGRIEVGSVRHRGIERWLDVEHDLQFRRGIACLHVFLNLLPVALCVFVQRIVEINDDIGNFSGGSARVKCVHLRLGLTKVASQLVEEAVVKLTQGCSNAAAMSAIGFDLRNIDCLDLAQHGTGLRGQVGCPLAL
jgi:hypothetical protein